MVTMGQVPVTRCVRWSGGVPAGDWGTSYSAWSPSAPMPQSSRQVAMCWEELYSWK